MPVHRGAILVFLVALLAAGANARLVRHPSRLPIHAKCAHHPRNLDGTDPPSPDPSTRTFSPVRSHPSHPCDDFSPSPQDIFHVYRSRRFGAEPVNVDENASPADPVRQPELAKFVDERKRVFSVGLDPDVEQTAAEWFESLGYATLTGSVHYTKGFWGGVKTEADPRLGVSVCTGTSDVTLVDGYDFANWLPIPAVVDSLVLDYPDAKFLLFETHVDDWIRRVSVKATEAARLGAECGCVGENAVRSSRPKCGDSTHHYCDLYPCLWEQQFATREVDPLAWREAYVNHVAKVKTSVPSERLLVVPMLADQSPVAVAQRLDPSWSSPPRRWSSRRRIHSSRTSWTSGGNKGGVWCSSSPSGCWGSRCSSSRTRTPARDSPGTRATSATERRVGGTSARARARAVAKRLTLTTTRRDDGYRTRTLRRSTRSFRHLAAPTVILACFCVLGDDLEPSRHFARRVARVSRGSTRSAHGDTIEVWKVRREMRRVSPSRPRPSPGPASSRSAGTTASPSTCSG